MYLTTKNFPTIPTTPESNKIIISKINKTISTTCIHNEPNIVEKIDESNNEPITIVPDMKPILITTKSNNNNNNNTNKVNDDCQTKNTDESNKKYITTVPTITNESNSHNTDNIDIETAIVSTNTIITPANIYKSCVYQDKRKDDNLKQVWILRENQIQLCK